MQVPEKRERTFLQTFGLSSELTAAPAPPLSTRTHVPVTPQQHALGWHPRSYAARAAALPALPLAMQTAVPCPRTAPLVPNLDGACSPASEVTGEDRDTKATSLLLQRPDRFQCRHVCKQRLFHQGLPAAALRHRPRECEMFYIFLNNLEEMGGEVTMSADNTRSFDTEKGSNYGNTHKTN